MLILTLFIGKLCLVLIKTLTKRSGSTWPGEIILRIYPKIISVIINKNPTVKTVFVVGTNGKTTTTSLLKHILLKKGNRVIQNHTGANLLNGISSTILNHVSLSGKLDIHYALFEIDEYYLPSVLAQFQPTVLLVLNIFRDQLDRYGETTLVAKRWNEAIQHLSDTTTLVLNADDPQVYFLGNNHSKTKYYSLPVKLGKTGAITLPNDVDSIYCPRCGDRLTYDTHFYSHLGKYYCKSCKLDNRSILPSTVKSSLFGIYNISNATAVKIVVEHFFPIDSDEFDLLSLQFKPAFGRQESIEYKNRQFTILLSKNPTGCNQSILACQEILKQFGKKKSPFVILINDQIPDGRDISWIWDVDIEPLRSIASMIVCGGDRGYDMKIRISYGLHENRDLYIEGTSDVRSAINTVIKKTVNGDHIFVLCTYSAMLQLRKILTGKTLL